MAKVNQGVAKVAKKALAETVQKMTPEECLRVMPAMMKMMGGKTPQMTKMMGK